MYGRSWVIILSAGLRASPYRGKGLGRRFGICACGQGIQSGGGAGGFESAACGSTAPIWKEPLVRGGAYGPAALVIGSEGAGIGRLVKKMRRNPFPANAGKD